MMFQTLRSLTKRKDTEGQTSTQKGLNQTTTLTNMSRLERWTTLLRTQLNWIRSKDLMRLTSILLMRWRELTQTAFLTNKNKRRRMKIKLKRFSIELCFQEGRQLRWLRTLPLIWIQSMGMKEGWLKGLQTLEQNQIERDLSVDELEVHTQRKLMLEIIKLLRCFETRWQWIAHSNQWETERIKADLIVPVFKLQRSQKEILL